MDKTKYFIKKAIETHGKMYNYSNSVYKNSEKDKITIVCEKHGKFKQTAHAHLEGQGCKECYLENSGYSRRKFIYFARKSKCRMYLIKCFSENEGF